MMMDMELEVLRAAIIGSLFLFLMFSKGSHGTIRQISGWKFIVSGFFMVFFGTLIDVADNFDSLNKFEFIRNPEYQAVMEKIVGYLLGFLLFAIGFWKWLPRITENERQATVELKKLQGILPICSHCKNMRDDDQYWKKLESFLSAHSEAECGHGMCPECAKKYGIDLNILDIDKD
ncbi:hypothetical protein ACFLZM_03065 [Thermodesulfobacteriota bacterium]